MPWIESFTMIMRSNLTALQERFADPEKMVHQLLVDMDEELAQVRHAVSKAIADEILLGKKVDRAREEAARWEKRAQDALKRGDEPSATAALERKLTADELCGRLDDSPEDPEAV